MSKKQDRCAPRTATDIERKYDLGQLNSGISNARVEMQVQKLNQSFSQFSATVNGKIEEVQGDITEISKDIESINAEAEKTDRRLTELESGDVIWTSANIVDLIYPVGSIYTAFNHTNPATLFGGTWERLQDAFLYACSDTENIGDTDGEREHTLTIGEIPSHDHAVNGGWGSGDLGLEYFRVDENNPATPWQNTSTVGGGLPHNNMPPYIKVSMWKRTA